MLTGSGASAPARAAEPLSSLLTRRPQTIAATAVSGRGPLGVSFPAEGMDGGVARCLRPIVLDFADAIRDAILRDQASSERNIYIGVVNSVHDFFQGDPHRPMFDVESIGDGPRVPIGRAHLEVVLTQLLAATARAPYNGSIGVRLLCLIAYTKRL